MHQTNLLKPRSEAQLAQDFMCRQLLAYAEEFYKNPENRAAFEAWRKNKKEKNNDASHNHP